MRSPDYSTLWWCLGGAAPLGLGDRAWGWLLPNSPSHPLSRIAPLPPPFLPAQPNTRSPISTGHRLTPVPEDLSYGGVAVYLTET